MGGKPHVLVVGGSRGIGLATVKAFLHGGAAVSIVSRRPPEEPIPDVRHWPIDVRDHGALPGRLRELVEEAGPVQHAVFLQRHRGDGEAWESEMAVSLGAMRILVEAVLPLLTPDADHGLILVSSLAGRLVAEEQSLAYHVAKAGLEQMVRWYAVRLGRQGIRVNAVALGAVLKQEARSFYAAHPDLVRLYADITPLGRMGTAEEVAQVIRFLSTPAASFMTGQTLVVDGGLSLVSQEALARRVSPLLRDLPVTRPPGRSA